MPEFLRAISGYARNEYNYITSFTGRKSISIKIDKDEQIDWQNIVPRIVQLGQAYDQDQYKEIFPGYDKFHFETDREKIERLDEALFEKLRNGDLANIHLAPPEFFDFDTQNFSYRDDEDAPHFDDLVLQDLLQSRRAFGGRSSIKSIRNMRVYVWDVETGGKVKEWSAYKCLVAELELDGETYILSMSQWKQVSHDLKQEVEAYVSRIDIAEDRYLLNNVNIWNPEARKNKQGNPIGENREEVYNDTVAAACTDIFLFDKAKVQIADERIYEVCDLLHRDKVLVHVKRLRSGAASITHLFLQGRFYGDAFVIDAKCRESMRDHIVKHIGDRDSNLFVGTVPNDRDDLVTNQYRIVFCILNEDPGIDVNSLPFMARYELMYTHRHLHDALGFQCEVAFRQIQLGP